MSTSYTVSAVRLTNETKRDGTKRNDDDDDVGDDDDDDKSDDGVDDEYDHNVDDDNDYPFSPLLLPF